MRRGSSRWSAPELGKRLEAWIWRRIEDLQLAYLLCWLVWSVSFQGVPVGVGGLDNAMSGKKEVWRGRFVRSTGDGGTGNRRLQQVFDTELEMKRGWGRGWRS